MRYCLLWCVFICGCPSLSTHYESAMAVVNQATPPTPEELEGALKDVDEAVRIAQNDLSRTDVENHDQFAYIIPMSEIARARLYARCDQVVNEERSCWKAIEEAERYLGRHLRSNAAQTMFCDYAVFFRREKIRRHAFTILIETYRRAGERDLEALMHAQIGFSDAYLRSRVAHSEEEYVREAENAGWVRKYNAGEEGIHHAFIGIILALGRAAEHVGIQSEISALEARLQNTYDPQERARILQRIRELRAQDAESEIKYQEQVREEEMRHAATLEQIEVSYRDTLFTALRSNFELLRLSPELQRLPAFRQLEEQAANLDNYVRRAGFDERAAAEFSQLRGTLDELTRQAQIQARARRRS